MKARKHSFLKRFSLPSDEGHVASSPLSFIFFLFSILIFERTANVQAPSGETVTEHRPNRCSVFIFGGRKSWRIIPTKINFLKQKCLLEFSISLEKGQRSCSSKTELISMDVNTQYKSAMLEFDMTQSLIGRFVGLEPSRVSRALTEEIPFDDDEKKLIEETIAAMRLVQSEMSLPINWAQIGKCKPRVDQRRKELHETADPVVRRCMLVRISGTGFFLRVNGTNVVTTPSEMNAAAFENPELGSEVVRKLKKLGTESRTESFGAFRRKSTMNNSLIEVGFEPVEEQDGR
jgi:hypothetical protein